MRWIDRGDAADVEIAACPHALPPHVDCIVHPPGPRVKRLLVADMDSTIIGQECIDELAVYAGVKSAVAAITTRAMAGELDFAEALAERVALLAGLDENVIAQCLAERISLSPGASTLVQTMAQRGATCVLVSGGFHAFCDPVADKAGFERVIANRLAVEGGKLRGTTEGPVIDGTAKKEALVAARDELGLSTSDVLAIGDGANDIAMIEEAGLGIAIHAKPALKAAADGCIDHHGLDALLWVQGIERSQWCAA